MYVFRVVFLTSLPTSRPDAWPPPHTPHPRYRILDAPVGYAPIRTPSRRLLATPTPMPMTPGFKMMQTPAREEYGVPATPTESSLPFIKPEDYQVL